MKIIVHYPTSEKGCKELARRVAEIHATATMQYIESLPCSKGQKLAMLDAIIQEKRQNNVYVQVVIRLINLLADRCDQSLFSILNRHREIRVTSLRKNKSYCNSNYLLPTPLDHPNFFLLPSLQSAQRNTQQICKFRLLQPLSFPHSLNLLSLPSIEK